MKPRIAIPVPHSFKPDYAQRSLPQYTSAIERSGAEAVVIPLDADPEDIARRLRDCDGILLPGSAADIDPQKYGAERDPKTENPDPKRDAADELLLQDAYNLKKPVLGICYGLQMLNVYRTGSLHQHLETGVNHTAGRNVPVAHTVKLDPVSRLHSILQRALAGGPALTALPVNSSHHQAADAVGDSLRVAARCPDDQVIEALEGTTADHWVLAVQWHPERTYDDPASRAIFDAFIRAARQYSVEHPTG
jgi:putative glutamine amidotransferase